MIRVIMFDVGDTLVSETDLRLFPHVIDALHVIQDFRTLSNDAVDRCLVSNFPAALPVLQTGLAATLKEFLAILPAELTAVFEPSEQRVTLSAHAGVPKPDPRVFLTALERLGRRATLAESLFITEEPEHVARCRGLGMTALQFGGHTSPPPTGADFTDWADAPLLCARAIDPLGQELTNLEAAVRARLLQTHPELENIALRPLGVPDQYRLDAERLVPLEGPELGSLHGIHVRVPVSGTLRLDRRGRIVRLDSGDPSPDEIAEARQTVRTLLGTGQVEGVQGGAGMPPTHEVIVDARGRRCLRRTRFRAG